MEQCPCGSTKTYTECCEPIIKGTQAAETPEALMRSRYSAYSNVEIDHIINSTSPLQRKDLDENATRTWAERAEWRGLEIVGCEGGGADDDEGTVEFIASYLEGSSLRRHHELGRFRRVDGAWYYEDGEMVKSVPVVRDTSKVGRNEPCPCGSGKKHKKCCGA